jgi:uncharacterized protein (TIGR00255 family)
LIRSMTGFGRAEIPFAGGALLAEVRTTNARHLELRARLPRALAALEPALRTAVGRHFARGQVELSLRLPPDAEGAEVAVSDAAARRYVDAARRLAREHGLEGSLSIGALLALPGVVQVGEAGGLAAGTESALLAAVDAACRDAAAMRQREGEALARDLATRVARVEAAVGEIDARAGEVRSAAREKLRRRLAQLAGELELDSARFEQEVVYWVDRMDVTEEIVRLRAHLAAFRKDLEGDAPVGRRLEFLLQEIGREANTLGSKAADAQLAALAVETKTELEKIREQVHNVE